ncbi:MAG: SusC/RagA family TonB-linked outer membrane protein [Muribaculaceae bacterium]|nr:SusC/RagA family TonB-linked outer membrane protein [Muribaculaceae bacterium]MDE5713972.1 SusC/RagA family TonB-linked outer membrane protein [Muribaculaceae bacterium]
MRKLFFIMMAVLACTFSGLAQTKTYKGTVVDASNNEPLIGATVSPIGGGQGTATDIDGQFVISVPTSVKQVKVSYVGYTPVTVALKDGMVVKLNSSAENLDDVVVVAYGTQKKSSITGAISTVNAEEISKRPVSSVTAALEGSTPGITVTGNYGSPGESPTILIRGIGTVNGSTSPLYVVDGVPFGGNISDLNPDDIESMSVLKDAASAALYGNRASNGVILITTKRQKGERLSLNFRTAQGWYERAIPEYDRTDIPQFMAAEYMNLANAYMSNNNLQDLRNDPEEIHKYVTKNIFSDRLYGNYFTERDATKLYTLDGQLVSNWAMLPEVAGDLDWFDQATRNGYRQEYSLNGAGATAKSDYAFSISYLGEEGYMKDSNFDRITGRASINITPARWIRSGLNVGVSHQKYQNTSNGVGDGSSSFNNPFYFCRYIAPIYPVHAHYADSGTVYDANGVPVQATVGDWILDEKGNRTYDKGYYTIYDAEGNKIDVNTRNQNTNRNIILESEVNRGNTVRNTMNAIGYVDFLLPYGFTATLKGNLNTRNSEFSKYGSALIGDSEARHGSLSKTTYNYKNYTFQQQLNWNKTYGEHNIQVLLGHENYSYLYDYTYVVKDNEAFANLKALSNFSVMNSIDGYRSTYRTESYLGRVMWNFKDTYNLEASVRRDGTSRFAKKSRWGTFGSVGANWIFSNEAFMEDVKWLNNGKLRADWGQVGNDAGSSYYAYYSLFTADTNASIPAYYLSQNAAEDLQWETSESWGIALETRMFNRWNLTLEYFDKRNKDLIFSVYYPVSSGPTSTESAIATTTQNLGTISNRGLEISTDFDIVKTKDWKVNIGANLTYIQNKIVSLPEQNKKVGKLAVDPSMQPPTGIASGSQFITEGKSRYEWYTYHWAGVDMMDGNSLYEANLVDYHIKKADGTIIGGAYEVDENGKAVLGSDGNPIRVSTELASSNYKEINGKYYVSKTTYAQKKWNGSALPNLYGSFSGNIGWKGFQLSAMFSYSLGGKIYDSVYSSLMSSGNTPSNYHVDVLNSWNGVPEGMTADSPDRINRNINPQINYLLSTDNNAASDRWLISRDYLCFKNLNLSYTIPTKLTSQWGLSKVQISFSAENLHIWGSRTGMNPMMSISGGQSNYLVPARVYTFGLNVNI